jgi:hypothetical protein
MFLLPNKLLSTWTVLLTAAFCFLQSCRSVEVTSPPNSALPSLTEANLTDVSLSLVSYDSVKIRHTLGSSLQSSNFVGISIGTKDSSGFKSFLTSSFPYDDNLKAFRVDFIFGITLDFSKISFPVTLRYKKVDSSFIDVDTTVLMYKYPYSSAEIFVTSQILRYKNPFDDIALKGNQLFFLVMGDDNLFVYDLDKSERTDLFYSGGDCIAADSNFVFCDIEHRTIARYNTTTQKVDSSFRLSGWDIAGLEVYNNHLYVLRWQKGLYKYTLDFSLVDSIEYREGHSYYITIDNNILYTTLLESSQIVRFDLVTRTFLPYMRAPSRRLSGIRVHRGRLYYCDIDRRIVGSVPLSDLVHYQ